MQMWPRAVRSTGLVADSVAPAPRFLCPRGRQSRATLSLSFLVCSMEIIVPTSKNLI